MLVLGTACTGGGHSVRGGARAAGTQGPLDRLGTVVQAVATDRKAVLATVEAVQVAATALDATDAVCVTGQGPAARTSHRTSMPLAASAAARLRVLAGQLAAYRSALRSLAAASVAVEGSARTALLRVVTSGNEEAGAVEVFRVRANQVWPQYVALDGFESLWIMRAVTPWYRSAQEGSDAYQVMVEDQRPMLAEARARLGVAVDAVEPVITRQTRTLAAADAALTAVRNRATK